MLFWMHTAIGPKHSKYSEDTPYLTFKTVEMLMFLLPHHKTILLQASEETQDRL